MKPRVRTNERIRAPEVRVIDQNGKMVGIIPTSQALELAHAQGLDLIEVSPKANPPVVKLLSFDKYRYHLEKALQQKHKRQKKVEVKGIRLSVRIGSHDLEFKASQARKFLGRGQKVKIGLMLRGREKANIGFAFEVMQKFLAMLAPESVLEQEPKRLGGTITAVITSKV